jgi:two-component sensor histidine kinase
MLKLIAYPGFRSSRHFRQALVLTLSIWFLFVYGTYVTGEILAGRTAFVREIPLDLISVLVVALLAHSLYAVAIFTADRGQVFRWAMLFAGSIIVAFAQTVVNLIENWLLGNVPSFEAAHHGLIRDRFGRYFFNHLYLSFANGALLIFLVEARRSAARATQLALSRIEAEKAKNAALRFQLDPHMLFNSLNSVSSLIVTGRKEQAEAMLERLTDFLRVTLRSDPEALVTVDEEIEAVDAYLAIEAVRFGERMSVEYDCTPDIAQARVPSLILQPLVENAVKYGVAKSRTPVAIRVSAAREGDSLLMSVVNDGASEAELPSTGFGVGLKNVRDRLERHHGNRGSLTTIRADGTFRSEVRLPLEASEGRR